MLDLWEAVNIVIKISFRHCFSSFHRQKVMEVEN